MIAETLIGLALQDGSLRITQKAEDRFVLQACTMGTVFTLATIMIDNRPAQMAVSETASTSTEEEPKRDNVIMLGRKNDE